MSRRAHDAGCGRFVAELQQMKTMGYTVCGLIEGGNDFPYLGDAESDEPVAQIA